MKKLNLNIIKGHLMKKDNMIILILTGVLCLVIAWPVSGNDNQNSNVTDLWDRKNDSIYTGNEAEGGENEIFADSVRGDADNQIFQEEYLTEKMEQRLEKLLSSMQGVGKVEVMITLANRGEKIVEKDIPLERNNVVENDSTGGSRSTNEMYSQEETVYVTNSSGDKFPYVIKENCAEVAGVSVVAQGGDDILVQKNISETIQALFGIEEHKIKVVKMKQQE